MAYVHTTRLEQDTELARRWLSYPLESQTPVKPQPFHALDKANDVRMRRAHLHQEIEALSEHDGRLRAAELVADPPEWVYKLEVGVLLGWVRRLGRRRVERLCTRAEVSSRARLGGDYGVGGPVLTPRQRRVLVSLLERTDA